MAAPDAGGAAPAAAGAPLLFLSHAGADTEAARRLKRRLEDAPDARAAGLRVWLDKDGSNGDGLVPGAPWQPQIEDAIERRATAFAVYVGSKGVVNWVEPEVRLALSRAATSGGRFPFVPVVAAAADCAALPGFVRQFQAVRDVENDGDEFKKLLAAVLGRGAEAGGLQAEASPFFGLHAIDEERSHLFFGREDETEELVQRLRTQRLLAVVGDSGSGKSSLVRAGLVPRWRGGALAELEGRRPDSDVWHVVATRPGRDPRRRLGEAVFAAAGALGRSAESRGTYLEWAAGDDPELRRQGLRCGLDPERTRTLVVVDQFEELVTRTPKGQRGDFVELLLGLADPADEAFSVALTMRRDYYNLLSAAECRPLHDRLEARNRAALYRLGRMRDKGLRRIVTEPLRLAGVGQGEREALAGAVLRDVGERPGDLALVQFALTRAWERRAEFGGDLLRAYGGVGRVDGALAGEAERVFKRELGGEANGAEVAATLVRLARLEGTAGPTRRVARKREFPDGRWALLQTLADARGNRLVLIGGRAPDGGAEPQDGRETAEIAHEALLTRWPRLRSWLDDAQDDKRALDRLADRAAEWADAPAGEAKDRLLARTHAEREAFGALRGARDAWLSDDEREFVDASIRAHDDALARESRMRHRVLVAQALAVVLTVAVVGAVALFFRGRAEASRAELSNRSQLLAASSERRTEAGDGIGGVLLALAALPADLASPNRPYVPRAEQALFAAVHANRERLALRHPASGANHVTAVAFGSDGRRVLTGSADGTARLWDAETGAEVGSLPVGANVEAIALSPRDDTLALVRSSDGVARLWDAARGGEPRRLDGHRGRLRHAGFSPDGQFVVTASLDGTARLWDARTGQQRQVFGGPEDEGGAVEDAAVSGDHGQVLTLGEDRRARLWDARTGRRLRTLEELPDPRDGGVVAAGFTQDDAQVVTLSRDGAMRLWVAEGDAGGRPFATASGSAAPGARVEHAAFSPSRAWLAIALSDGTVRVRATQTGQDAGPPLRETEGRVAAVAFSRDERLVATAASAETVAAAPVPRPARVWDLATGRPVATLRGHAEAVRAVALSPDAARVATGSDDGTARLWDARADRSIGALQGYRRRLRDGVRDGGLKLRPGQRRVALGLEDAPFAAGPEGFAAAAADEPGTVLAWGLGAGTGVPVPQGHESFVSAVATGPGARVVAGGFGGELRTWDARVPAAVRPLDGHADAVSAIAFDGGGGAFLTASWDGAVRLWNAADGTLRLRLRGHEGPVLAAAFSPDGRRVVTAGNDRTARVWDAADGKLVRALEHGHERVVAASFSPDGRRVLTAAWDGQARIWELSPAPGAAAGGVVALGHDGMVRAAAFDATGGFVVTVTEDGAAYVWRAEDGRKLGALGRENGAPILAAAFLPDACRAPSAGKPDVPYVVTAAEDGVAEVRAGPIPVAAFEGHRGAVTAVALPRADRLLTAGADRTLKLWRLPPTGQCLIDEAKRLKTRELSDDERARFFLAPADRPASAK